MSTLSTRCPGSREESQTTRMPASCGKRPSCFGYMLKPFSSASQISCPLSSLSTTGSSNGMISSRWPSVISPDPYTVSPRREPPQIRHASTTRSPRSVTRCARAGKSRCIASSSDTSRMSAIRSAMGDSAVRTLGARTSHGASVYATAWLVDCWMRVRRPSSISVSAGSAGSLGATLCRRTCSASIVRRRTAPVCGAESSSWSSLRS